MAEPQLASVTVLLPARHIEILQWLADGKRNEEIAEIMGLKRPQNVQAHVMRIMAATGTNTRCGAVAYALRRGLIK
jgi:DNA-binding CsgD family transcriptional regulator